ALARARPVAGDAALCRQLAQAVRRVLARERDPVRLARDVKAMRKLLAAEKGDDDIADVKNMRGGLVDIDFCVQFLILAHASRHAALLGASGAAVLDAAAAHGLVTPEEARRLVEARALYSELLQRERLHATDAQPI